MACRGLIRDRKLRLHQESMEKSEKIQYLQREIETLRRNCSNMESEINEKKSPDSADATLSIEVEKILELRIQLRQLSQSVSNTPSMDYPLIGMFLRSGIEHIDQRVELKNLREVVGKAFDFYDTCLKMHQSSDESLKGVLEESVRGGGRALEIKLNDYTKIFNSQDIANFARLIARIEQTITPSQDVEDTSFTEQEVINLMTSMNEIVSENLSRPGK